MLSVEFHCHTIFSSDSLTKPQDLVRTCRRKGIDRVIVTDHNSIRGAQAAHDLDPELVIVGEEILTTRGEILAAFVKEEIPARLSPRETIDRLKDQGAFISVDEFRRGGWKEDDLLAIMPTLDAIEVYNSRCMLPRFNRRAGEFAANHDLAGTVGSDAHAAFELGRSVLLLDPFEGPDGLRAVIREGIPRVKWTPWWVHLTSRHASMMKKLKS